MIGDFGSRTVDFDLEGFYSKIRSDGNWTALPGASELVAKDMLQQLG